MFERRARSFEDMGREHVRVWCLGIVLCAAGIVAFVLAAATLLQQSILLFSAAFAVFIVVVAVLAVLYPAMQGIFITAFYPCAKTVVVPSVQGKIVSKRHSCQGRKGWREGLIIFS